MFYSSDSFYTSLFFQSAGHAHLHLLSASPVTAAATHLISPGPIVALPSFPLGEPLCLHVRGLCINVNMIWFKAVKLVLVKTYFHHFVPPHLIKGFGAILCPCANQLINLYL